MANNGVTFALGLAQKAGKLASGDYAVRSALKNGKAKLLLVAADAAENSKKDMYFMAEMSDTPVVECLTRDELTPTSSSTPLFSLLRSTLISIRWILCLHDWQLWGYWASIWMIIVSFIVACPLRQSVS